MYNLKKLKAVFMAILFSAGSLLSAQDSSKILIAYFSRVGITEFNEKTDVVTSASLRMIDSKFVGNTELVAKMIRDKTDGELFQIKTVKTYPEKYRDTTDMALAEQRAGDRPDVTYAFNMDDYDVIFFGYPNWWGTLPMAIFTFLESEDLSGKRIIPFCTHEGSALGRTIEDLKRLAPNADIEKGLAIRGGRADRSGKRCRPMAEQAGILKI